MFRNRQLSTPWDVLNQLSSAFLLSRPSGVCIEADSGGALGREDWEDPSLTELQGIQLSGKQVGDWRVKSSTGITWKINCLLMWEGYLYSNAS